MRKSNNLPWMGRAIGIAVMVLVGVGMFTGQARAQDTLTDYAGWWDALSCSRMINVVNNLELNYYNGRLPSDGRTPVGTPPLVGTHVAADVNSGLDTARWCVMWMGLNSGSGLDDAGNLRTAATRGWTPATTAANTVNGITRSAGADIFNARQWWESIADGAAGGDNNNPARTRQTALGIAYAADAAANDPGAGYSALSRGNANLVDRIYYALMPGGMTPTPAVPLVGIGILGLLLAGRGAWLRRRP